METDPTPSNPTLRWWSTTASLVPVCTLAQADVLELKNGQVLTGKLETDLVAGGMMVAKTGTKVYGRVQAAQKAGRYAGQSKLDLRLAELTVGAAKGAAIGAVASGAKQRQAVTVPPGTLLEFQLQQPVNVNLAR